jgi:hypothetical protein
MIGLTLGLSILFRANNTGIQISIILTYFFLGLVEKNLRLFWQKLAFIGIGAISFLGGVGIYFWVKHAFYPMIEAAFLYNFFYTGSNPNLISGISSGVKNLGFTGWVALASYAPLVVISIKEIKTKTMNYFTLLLFIAFPVEIALSSLSGRNYGHYFISWLPVIAFLSAYTYSWLSPRIFTTQVIEFFNQRSGIALSLFIGVLIFVFWNPLQVYSKSIDTFFNTSNGVELISPVAQYVRANTNSDEKVLVWGGQAGLNYLAKRDSPTAYIFYPLFINSPITLKLSRGFYNDISTTPPVYIIDAYINAPDDVLSINPDIRLSQIAAGKGTPDWPPNLPQVFEFFQTNYEVDTVVDGYTIYRLKESGN